MPSNAAALSMQFAYEIVIGVPARRACFNERQELNILETKAAAAVLNSGTD